MTYGADKPILEKAIAFRKAHLDQQFGQTYDDAVWDGTTACTHAWWQFAAYLWTGIRLTLNQVNSLAGMPYKARNRDGDPRGMNSSEAAAFIANFNAKYGADKLPYKIVWDYTFEQLMTYSNRGPVGYGDDYGKSPTWRGYVYAGRTATSPFAAYAGKTQLGYSFRHFVGILGYRSVLNADGTIAYYHEWKFDPNHGSSARSERPPFEIIRTTEGKAEYNAYASHWGLRLYAAVPTRSLPVTAPTTYTAHFAAGAIVRIYTLSSTGCIQSWRDETWGSSASSAPCAAPVWRKTCDGSSSATTVKVTAGKYAGMYLRIGAGITFTSP